MPIEKGMGLFDGIIGITYWGLENLLKKPTDKITVKISLIYLIKRTKEKISDARWT